MFRWFYGISFNNRYQIPHLSYSLVRVKFVSRILIIAVVGKWRMFSTFHFTESSTGNITAQESNIVAPTLVPNLEWYSKIAHIRYLRIANLDHRLNGPETWMETFNKPFHDCLFLVHLGIKAISHGWNKWQLSRTKYTGYGQSMQVDCDILCQECSRHRVIQMIKYCPWRKYNTNGPWEVEFKSPINFWFHIR